MSAPPRIRSLTDWLLLAGFCAFLFFYGLAFFGLVGADEPRYAQVAREMFERHDWITPTLGGVAWLEKPVLYYWQAILAYQWFGVSDWASRLPSAVDAALMMVAGYFFLRRFRPGFELDGALMTASAAGIIGFARAASMDMPLAASFTIALLAWYGWFETEDRKYLAGFYVFLALATLAKGPVAPFLAAAILLLFVLLRRDWQALERTLWLPGILIFCVVALPWYVLVEIRNPQFFREFILEHNLARFGTNLYHHQEPFWYYLPVTLIGLIPWAVLVVAAMVESVRAWWKQKFADSEGALSAFCITWLLVPVVFFSLSKSKLPGYILPALPAGTLLLAEYVRRHVSKGDQPSWIWTLLQSVVAASPLVPALMIPYLLAVHRIPWGTAAKVAYGFAAILAIAMFLTLRGKLGLRALRFVTLVPVVLTVAAVLRIEAPILDSTLSARPLVTEMQQMGTELPPVAVLAVPRETQYGLAFYLNKVISRYESGEIPAGAHILVAPEGSLNRIQKRIPDRRVSYLNSFRPQHYDYYWVAPAGMEHHH